jgi:hypothetical protein
MPVSDDTPAPWLSIVGIGEDGLEGLSAEARNLLARAELVAGGRRHLALVAALGKPMLEWDTPFSTSIPKLLEHRGRRVVALCSGDPFWYGAGSTFADAVAPEETIAIPAPSSFAWAAAKLRWRLEETVTLGLHARPIELLRPQRGGNTGRSLSEGRGFRVLWFDGSGSTGWAARAHPRLVRRGLCARRHRRPRRARNRGRGRARRGDRAAGRGTAG